MILTKRDKEILKFIESYGSITINQCSKIFFGHCKQNYYQTRKRLKLLADNGYLKRYRKDMRTETVYYQEKKLSFHDLKVLDVYAYVKSVGADITFFKQEYSITLKDKEYRADGFLECLKDNYFFPIIIESDISHLTGEKKLMDIYNSGYFQDKYKDMEDDIFPTVVIVRPVIPSIDVSHLPYSVLYADYCMYQLSNLFI